MSRQFQKFNRIQWVLFHYWKTLCKIWTFDDAARLSIRWNADSNFSSRGEIRIKISSQSAVHLQISSRLLSQSIFNLFTQRTRLASSMNFIGMQIEKGMFEFLMKTLKFINFNWDQKSNFVDFFKRNLENF